MPADRPGWREVDCLLSDPSTDDHLYVMATMLPVSPLQPDNVYTATMTVRWGGAEETFVSTSNQALSLDCAPYGPPPTIIRSPL